MEVLAEVFAEASWSISGWQFIFRCKIRELTKEECKCKNNNKLSVIGLTWTISGLVISGLRTNQWVPTYCKHYYMSIHRNVCFFLLHTVYMQADSIYIYIIWIHRFLVSLFISHNWTKFYFDFNDNCSFFNLVFPVVFQLCPASLSLPAVPPPYISGHNSLSLRLFLIAMLFLPGVPPVP